MQKVEPVSGEPASGEPASGEPAPTGKAALIASIGGQRGYADWTNPDHRLRRLLLRGPARVQEALAARGTPLDSGD